MAFESVMAPKPREESVGPRIGYVLKRYPRLSETFVVQEILQLERRGANLVLFPIMDPTESLRNPEVDVVRAPVVYLQRSLGRDAPGMLVDHVCLLVTSPRRYCRAVSHLFIGSQISRASLKVFLQSGRLARLAQEMHIDHLHAHWAHNPTSLARYASLLTGIPFSFTAHAKDLYLTRPESIADKTALADFVTTCTAYNADYLHSIVRPADCGKIHVVYHGVDTDRFRPQAARLNNPAPLVVAVGRLVAKKGYGQLIAAAQLLHERQVPFRLEIYGEGLLRQTLQQQIDAARLEAVVQLCGARTQEDLISMYQRADVFVLAPVVTEDGDRDGIPNVLLEAMAIGLPVVSTYISGIPEVVKHDVNGLLVAPGDASALAEAMETVLTSVTLRGRLAEAARESVVAQFDATNNVTALVFLLKVGEPHTNSVHSR